MTSIRAALVRHKQLLVITVAAIAIGSYIIPIGKFSTPVLAEGGSEGRYGGHFPGKGNTEGNFPGKGKGVQDSGSSDGNGPDKQKPQSSSSGGNDNGDGGSKGPDKQKPQSSSSGGYHRGH